MAQSSFLFSVAEMDQVASTRVIPGFAARLGLGSSSSSRRMEPRLETTPLPSSAATAEEQLRVPGKRSTAPS